MRQPQTIPARLAAGDKRRRVPPLHAEQQATHQHRQYQSADNSQGGSQANQPRGLTEDETIDGRPSSTKRTWRGLAPSAIRTPISRVL